MGDCVDDDARAAVGGTGGVLWALSIAGGKALANWDSRLVIGSVLDPGETWTGVCVGADRGLKEELDRACDVPWSCDTRRARSGACDTLTGAEVLNEPSAMLLFAGTWGWLDSLAIASKRDCVEADRDVIF